MFFVQLDDDNNNKSFFHFVEVGFYFDWNEISWLWKQMSLKYNVTDYSDKLLKLSRLVDETISFQFHPLVGCEVWLLGPSMKFIR